MVNEEGQALGRDVGIGDEGVHWANFLELGGDPLRGDAVDGDHVRHAANHLAVAVVDAEEAGASAYGSGVAEADVDLGLAAAVSGEPAESVAAKEAQEDHLVAQQGEVMGDVASHASSH